MKLKVMLHKAREGGYWVEAPALPGCVSEGDTRKEALDNIREAAQGWLEVAESVPLVACPPVRPRDGCGQAGKP